MHQEGITRHGPTRVDGLFTLQLVLRRIGRWEWLISLKRKVGTIHGKVAFSTNPSPMEQPKEESRSISESEISQWLSTLEVCWPARSKFGVNENVEWVSSRDSIRLMYVQHDQHYGASTNSEMWGSPACKYSFDESVPYKCRDETIWCEEQKSCWEAENEWYRVITFAGTCSQVEFSENSLQSTDEKSRHLACSSHEVEKGIMRNR
ncbi:hypothetical protein BC827DRAFT_1385874 [Russula dissimulans]|nr:hypothetical protein BC827DRAFT_1385874 [Russula dissimulans]